MEGEQDERPLKRPKLSQSNGPAVPEESDSKYHITLNLKADPRETQVGITAYVSHITQPFSAILKKRYTDFLVNEILPGGKIVHLTDTAVPEKLQPKAKSGNKDGRHEADITAGADITETVNQDFGSYGDKNGHKESLAHEQKNNDAQPQVGYWISDVDKQQLVEYLNPKAVSELLTLYQSINKHPQRKPKEHPLVRTEFTNDRTLRAEIHGCIRRVFSSRIESSTDKDGFLVLTAASPNNRQNGSRQAGNVPSSRPEKFSWAERGGEYLHFTLYKENKDTMEAISWLVRQMKINAKTFQFAGTKDRRAVTSQRVSAYRVDVKRLAGNNKSLRGARVGDFEYQPSGLELGDLAGNEFTITLRECEFQVLQDLSIQEKVQTIQDALETAMTSLHHQGYLNYFGLQRFGTFAARTDSVGLHILTGDYKAAVEAILDFDPDVIPDADKASIEDSLFDDLRRDERSDDTSRALALLVFKVSSNFQKAMDILPRKFSAEISIMRHLQRQPTNFLGALMSITRNLRLMYVHAYQSLVWNHAVTQRMAKYGSDVVKGDLVLISEHRDKNEHVKPGSNNNANDTSNDVDADGEVIIAPSTDDRATNVDDAFERAKPLSAEEASSGKYTIFDIVLPLPGYDILYPDHDIGAFYKSFMADHGNLDPMDMRRKQRDFSLSGSYRKILSRIGSDWTVGVKSYTKDDEQFVKTDLDLLKERQNAQQDGQIEGGASTAVHEREERPVGEEEEAAVTEKIAAILKFKLGSSQYATMALRELSRGGIVGYKPDWSGLKAGSS